MRAMRPIARAGDRNGRRSARPRHRSPTRRRRHRRARSTPPIPTRATSRRCAGGCRAKRAGRDQRAPDRDRGRADQLVSGLRADRADGHRRSPRAAQAGVGECPRSCSRMPATGNRSRCKRSPATGSRSSSRPTRRSERAPGLAGTAASTRYATRAGHPQRRGALPQTDRDDRAGLRRHQIQPQDRPLPTPRPSRLPLGMAPDHRYPQHVKLWRHTTAPTRPEDPRPDRPSPVYRQHRRSRGNARARHLRNSLHGKPQRRPRRRRAVPLGGSSSSECLVALQCGVRVGGWRRLRRGRTL